MIRVTTDDCWELGAGSIDSSWPFPWRASALAVICLDEGQPELKQPIRGDKLWCAALRCMWPRWMA